MTENPNLFLIQILLEGFFSLGGWWIAMEREDYDRILENVGSAYETLADKEDFDMDGGEPLKWRMDEPTARASWSEDGVSYNISATVADIFGEPNVYIEANAKEDDYESQERQWTHHSQGLFHFETTDFEKVVSDTYIQLKDAELDRVEELDLTKEELSLLRGEM